MLRLFLLAVLGLCWSLSSAVAEQRGSSWVEREVDNQAECESICRGAGRLGTYCYYWRETRMCRLSDDRLPNVRMKGPYQIFDVRDGRWLTQADVAAILKSQPVPAPANLAGRWQYKGGAGQMTVTQQGDEVIMKLTWVSSPIPGPHYTVKAWLKNNGLLQGWWYCDHQQSCPRKWLTFEATIDERGDTISITDNTEDPSGEGWAKLVIHRVP